MRVVVTGATGNVGTSVIEALAKAADVNSVIGLARRLPRWDAPKTEWAAVDLRSSDLREHLRAADAVIHLAWLIQPSRDQSLLRAVNVEGSERLFQAIADVEVPSLIYASSVGAYSPGPKERLVGEEWPTEGIETSFYSRHKAEVEHILDRFESEVPSARVVRLRPALIFKGEAAEEIRRLFAGPFLPSPLLHRRLIPFVPGLRGLRFQAVHSRDVGKAYALAATKDVRGAFNIAADPVIGPEELADALGARAMPIRGFVLRYLTELTWRLRLQPTPPGWLDMALQVPLMDTRRARDELGWNPRHSSIDALLELLEGIRRGTGMPTPLLEPEASGPARSREIKTGVGTRQ
jgi:nucleoside-diphosphate-sugar epimerase